MWLLLTATKEQIVESLLKKKKFLTARHKLLKQSKSVECLERNKQVYFLCLYCECFLFILLF